MTMFQIMINKLLRNLINAEKVESFINNVMVETESEEGHNELIEEILKRMGDDDLYMKPEKCKWKNREINFLKVEIEPDGIKIEKEKIKVILD